MSDTQHSRVLMLGMFGTERAVLVSLAATIAAGIEANPDNRAVVDEVALRAVAIASAIIAEVAK